MKKNLQFILEVKSNSKLSKEEKKSLYSILENKISEYINNILSTAVTIKELEDKNDCNSKDRCDYAVNEKCSLCTYEHECILSNKYCELDEILSMFSLNELTNEILKRTETEKKNDVTIKTYLEIIRSTEYEFISIVRPIEKEK